MLFLRSGRCPVLAVWCVPLMGLFSFSAVVRQPCPVMCSSSNRLVMCIKKYCSEARSCVDASLAGDAAFIAATLLTARVAEKPAPGCEIRRLPTSLDRSKLGAGARVVTEVNFSVPSEAKLSFAATYRHFVPAAFVLVLQTLFSVQIYGVWEFIPLECTLCGRGKLDTDDEPRQCVRMGNQILGPRICGVTKKVGTASWSLSRGDLWQQAIRRGALLQPTSMRFTPCLLKNCGVFSVHSELIHTYAYIQPSRNTRDFRVVHTSEVRKSTHGSTSGANKPCVALFLMLSRTLGGTRHAAKKRRKRHPTSTRFSARRYRSRLQARRADDR